MAGLKNNYEAIAPIYDSLKKLVFGDSLIKTELHFLKSANHIEHLLVIGCGSAKFIEELDMQKTEKITLIDSSKKMCLLAKRRINRLDLEDKIKVQNVDFFKWHSNEKYSHISAAFFLDCLNDSQIDEVLNKMKKLVEKDGRLIVSDFARNTGDKAFYNVLIRSMYLFFNFCHCIQRTNTPDYQMAFSNTGWLIEEEYQHPDGKLFSQRLKKI